MKNNICLLVFFLFFPALVIVAQSEDRTISLSINAAYNYNENEFHDYWNSTPGAGFELSFEDDVGEIGAGLRLMRFNKIVESTKSFYGVDYYFLYRHYFSIHRKIDFVAGFDFGIFEFRFDDDVDIKTLAERFEREFAIKLVTGMSFSLSESWKAELTTAYNHIYTRKKIELFYLSVGITKTFSAPAWLKELFE
jgi:hypothetical protein